MMTNAHHWRRRGRRWFNRSMVWVPEAVLLLALTAIVVALGR